MHGTEWFHSNVTEWFRTRVRFGKSEERNGSVPVFGSGKNAERNGRILVQLTSFSVRAVTDTSRSSRFHQIGGTTWFRIYRVYSLLRNDLVPFLPSNRTQGWVLGAEPFRSIPPNSRTERILIQPIE
jgi:hypothetical protein